MMKTGALNPMVQVGVSVSTSGFLT